MIFKKGNWDWLDKEFLGLCYWLYWDWIIEKSLKVIRQKPWKNIGFLTLWYACMIFWSQTWAHTKQLTWKQYSHSTHDPVLKWKGPLRPDTIFGVPSGQLLSLCRHFLLKESKTPFNSSTWKPRQMKLRKIYPKHHF